MGVVFCLVFTNEGAFMSGNEIAVHDNTAAHRYEVELGGELAILTYRLHGDTITFLHTEVPPELEGHGLGGRLAQTALDEARARGLAVIPSCPFVATYIRRHPDYMSLLPQAEQVRLRER